MRSVRSCCSSSSSWVLAAISDTLDLSRSDGVLMRLLSSWVLRSKSAWAAARLWRDRSRLRRDAGQIGLESGKVAAHAHQLCLRLLRCQAIGDRIDRQQFVARFEELALDDGYAHDLARHLRRDQHLLGADVGVVGRHVAAAEEIEDERHHGDERRDQHQKGQAQRRQPGRVQAGGHAREPGGFSQHGAPRWLGAGRRWRPMTCGCCS